MFWIGKDQDRDTVLDPRETAGRRKGAGKRELTSPASPPYVPFLSIYVTVGAGRCHSTHNAADDARDAMQIVDATCILDP